jgi:hypothetical protein
MLCRMRAPGTIPSFKPPPLTMPRRPGSRLFEYLVCVGGCLLLETGANMGAVTYTDHYVSSSPDWTINATWLQRVSDVVDMATSRGLYVITNMHHGRPPTNVDHLLCVANKEQTPGDGQT